MTRFINPRKKNNPEMVLANGVFAIGHTVDITQLCATHYDRLS